MPLIADYNTIAPATGGDTGFSLNFPATPNRDFNFNLTPDTGVDFNSRSVLAFLVSSNNGDNIILRVRVNGTNQAIYTIPTGHHVGTLHEILNPGILQNNPNNVEFLLESPKSGSGSVRISDLVVFYQRNI